MQRGRDIIVRLFDADRIRVEVIDEGPGFDPPTPSSWSNPTGGWGLQLVDRLADEWGVEAEGPCNKVWFELRPETAA